MGHYLDNPLLDEEGFPLNLTTQEFKKALENLKEKGWLLEEGIIENVFAYAFDENGNVEDKEKANVICSFYSLEEIYINAPLETAEQTLNFLEDIYIDFQENKINELQAKLEALSELKVGSGLKM